MTVRHKWKFYSTGPQPQPAPLSPCQDEAFISGRRHSTRNGWPLLLMFFRATMASFEESRLVSFELESVAFSISTSVICLESKNTLIQSATKTHRVVGNVCG